MSAIQWSCAACTFLNTNNLHKCEICGSERSNYTQPAEASDEDMELTDSPRQKPSQSITNEIEQTKANDDALQQQCTKPDAQTSAHVHAVSAIGNTGYKFADMNAWLNEIGLSHLQPALLNAECDSLSILVSLDDTELSELVSDDIAQYFESQSQQKLSVAQKGKFKSAVRTEREKYHLYLANLAASAREQKQDESDVHALSLSNTVLTAEEQTAMAELEKLVQFVSEWGTALNQSEKMAKSQRIVTMKTLSELMDKIECALADILNVTFAKYSKFNKYSVQYSDGILAKMLAIQRRCEQSVESRRSGNKDSFDIVEAYANIGGEFGEQFLEWMEQSGAYCMGEVLQTLLHSVLSNVSLIKSIQQTAAYMLSMANVASPLYAWFTHCPGREDDKFGDVVFKKGSATLLILPHAEGFMDEISAELKAINVSIQSESVRKLSNEDFTKVSVRYISDLIGEGGAEFDAKEKRKFGGSGDEGDEQKVVEGADSIFPAEHVPNALDDVQFAAYYCIEQYLQSTSGQARLCTIEIAEDLDGFDMFLKRMDLFCPALIGEFAVTYFPHTLNGKLMKKYVKQVGQEKVDSMVMFGFIQLVPNEFVEKLTNEQ